MENDLTSRAYEARCSFCRKGQEAVNALIAGPGVYLCNECADTAVEAFGKLGKIEHKVPYDPAAHFRSLESERLMTLVGRVDHVYQDVADQQALMVAILRERQVSWAQIGEALGVTRQAAWRRFASGPEVD